MPETRLLVPKTGTRRATRTWRTVRAVWRSLRVIWREFRVPLVLLLIALFVGGWLYGELEVQTGFRAERRPFYDLPYAMLTLMIFASTDSLPEQHLELVAFWYIMPVIGAYVAARGMLDFANLFLRNDLRRHSWEEAMASTNRNHIIVLGVGHLGLRVLRALVHMGFDVVAIDYGMPPETEGELHEMGVGVVQNDGRMANTLETAAIQHAQALIVCTSNDHMNLEVTMRARDLNPKIRIVVRVWDDRFAEQIEHFMNVEAVLSTTDLAAPSFAASALGIEITQTLNVNGVDYSMIRLHVTPGSFMDGQTIGALQTEHDMDIVLQARSDAVEVHPPGDTVVHAGDTLVIFAEHSKIVTVVARNQRRQVISR